MNNTLGKSAQSPLSPSQLNRVVRNHLEADFPAIWISGEIAETYLSAAGHNYFTLKDESSSVKCVFFKNFNIHSNKIKIGDKATILGNLTLYLSRGDFQVNVRRIMQTGTGRLELQFLKLKQKLESIGLFDRSHKKSIPKVVNSLAVITSKKGAAIKDILNILKSHNPLINVTIYNSLVQGEKAVENMIAQLSEADNNKHDAILLTRGGGSREDLWCFNDEQLAYRISKLNTPVLSAIGHEEDNSIADLVSDMAAITPTAAAHLLAGDFKELITNLQHTQIRLNQHIISTIKNQQQALDLQLQALKTVHPKQKIALQNQQLTSQKSRLNSILTSKLKTDRQNFSLLKQKLYSNTPDIEFAKTTIKQQINKLNHLSTYKLTESKSQQLLTMTRLNDQNPLKILSQGYSYTINLDDNRSTVTSNKQVKKGTHIETILKSGRIHAKITEHFDD